MSDRRYIIGSGYIGGDQARDNFATIWVENLERNPHANARQVFIVCSRGESPTVERPWITKIKLDGDLGHICRTPNRKHQIEGWPATVMATALIAYNDESDFVFVEQDCLFFGDCIGKMYQEIGEAGCIFGSNSWMDCAQSLFLVKHPYIPKFVLRFLEKKVHNKDMQGERLFKEMEQENKGEFKRFSFGYDRDRPKGGFASVKNDTFYVQQISFDEIQKLKEEGLIV